MTLMTKDLKFMKTKTLKTKPNTLHSLSNLHIASNIIGRFFKIIKIKPIVKSSKKQNQIKCIHIMWSYEETIIHFLRESSCSHTRCECGRGCMCNSNNLCVNMNTIAFEGESNNSINFALQTPINI